MNETKDIFVISSGFKRNNHIEYSYIEAYSYTIDEALEYAHQEIKKCADRFYDLHKRVPIVEYFDIGYRLTYNISNDSEDYIVVTYTIDKPLPSSDYMDKIEVDI